MSYPSKILFLIFGKLPLSLSSVILDIILYNYYFNLNGLEREGRSRRKGGGEEGG
jgi:hypothetical protein